MRRFGTPLALALLVGAAVALVAAADVLDGGDAWLLLPLAALLAGGFAWGRWRALAVLGVLPWVGIALALDAAWVAGVWDRSDEYEPLPATPFAVVALPLPAGVVALGVSARRAARER